MVNKTVTLTFPVNSLQVLNFTPANYGYYNIYLPLVNADTQLGTEITFVKCNSVVMTSTVSQITPANQLWIGCQSGNTLWGQSGTSNALTATNLIFYTSAKIVAIKNSSGSYGWYITNLN